MNKKRYTKSNKFIKVAENYIPLGSQTFSKSKTQYPQEVSPLFIEKGKGSRVWDIDGNEYVDLVCGLLPITLGYCDLDVNRAINKQLKKGITFSLPSMLEAQLAKILIDLIPCAEMVRFGKNGSDVTSAAIRLARAVTKKNHIIAIGYHGWQDWYIGATSRNLGVPQSVSALTHKVNFNDLDELQQVFKKFKNDVAAIIMEPMNTTEPLPTYLENVKKIAHKNNSLLIFDEVITGFRFDLGGAQKYFGVKPDLAAFGKGMGNGMPISAIVGPKYLMKYMEDIFFSGTFGGETLSLVASIVTIEKMKNNNVIKNLWKKGSFLQNEVNIILKNFGLQNVIYLSGKPPWVFLNFNLGCMKQNRILKTFFYKSNVK